MDEAAEFDLLMQRFRSGSEEAKRELFERFAEGVRRVVRNRLSRRLRRRYDSEDFTQIVWSDFFEAPPDRYAFASPNELVAFLSRMACFKVMETTRQRLRHRHSARATSLDAPDAKNGQPVGENLVSPGATPSEVVMADERWQQMVQGLPPGHCRILELLRDGYTAADILRRLPSIHRKLIERLLDKLNRYRNAL
jgi:DNA-directed RNA polymerase specialized sigma24 family protein